MMSSTVNDVRRRLRSRRRIRAIAVGLLFLVAFGLIGAWVRSLVHRPRLTPMVTVTVTDYAWPVEPNAWAHEDAERLKSLDDQSLRILDLSPEWRTRELALKRLDDELAALAASQSLSATVVFYFSMHGVVDSDGQPYLLPADASPFDSRSWLPVSEVLDRIAGALPRRVHKLILLDSNRTQANWKVGQLYNTFAERLRSAIDLDRHPNMVLINSASPDQVAWSSAPLGGSVFGYFVARGIGGAADRPLSSPANASSEADSVTAGNADGRVTLNELTAYLDRETEQWCRANRMPAQAIMQVPPQATDFAIAWSLSERGFEQTQQQWELDSTPAISADRLDTLWRQFAELPRQSLLSVAPEVLNELEHELLWLEQLSVSGRGYHAAATRQLAHIGRRLQEVQRYSDDGTIDRSPVALRRNWLNQPSPELRGTAAPSLQLSVTLGSIPSDDAEAALRQWASLEAEPGASQLEATIERLDAINTASKQSGAFDSAHFLRLMKRYQTLQRWTQREPIATVLRLRSTADRLAVMRLPDGSQELRSTPWVKPLIDRADQSRRRAEDWLLAGEDAAASHIHEQLRVSENAYESASRRLVQVTDAIATRDDALQRLPYLAHAMAVLMPQPEAADATSDPGDSDDPIATLVIPALRDAIALSRQIDQRDTTDAGDDGTIVPFFETSDRLKATLGQLDKILQERVAMLIDDPEAPSISRLQVNAALTIPWLSWQQRHSLREIEDRIARASHLPADQAAPASDDPNQIDWGLGTNALPIPTLTTLDRTLSWPVHPAVLISRSEAVPSVPVADSQPAGQPVVAAESGVARIEQLGYQVREALGRWNEAPRVGGGGAGGGGESSRWIDDATGVNGLAWAARWQRRILPLSSTRQGNSPLETRWRDNLQRLVLWHADRQLDAFLGTPTGPASSGLERSFFDVACSQCLDLIDKIAPSEPSVQSQRAAVRRKQLSRRIAANGGLRTTAEHSPLAASKIDVTVRPLDPGDLSDEGFPLGRSSVWVQDEQGRVATEVATIELPLSQSQTFDLAPLLAPATDTLTGGAHPLLTSSPLLTAVAMFRGNEYRRPFVVNRLGGTTVSYQPYRYGASTIALLGQRQRRASVLFVLDCSRSMEEPLPSEAASDEAPSKLSLAKTALIEMLDELSQQDSTRIGVIFFGHRVAWTRSDPPKRSQSPGAGVELPEGLMPSDDVEMVLPLGRFDAGRVLQRLDQVQPWGQSPLNQSLVQAIRAFASDDADTEKSIVVITDGRDYQFTPSRSDIRKSPKTTQSDVLRAAQATDVPIYMLGFGLESDERAAAEAEFGEIATSTGGEAIAVDDASELLRQLRGKLAMGSFSLQPSSRLTRSRSENRTVAATLNGTVTLGPDEIAKGRFELVFESLTEPIPLVGGEALQIRLSADGRQLLPIPFDWQFPTLVELATGPNNKPTPYVFRAHRPQQHGDVVTFPISIQSTRDPVTPRPTETWLTVTPMIEGVEQRDQRYYFGDANFEPNQPVPLLNWEAHQWPSNADSAKLEFWCKFERTPPFKEIPLREVLDNPEAFVGLSLAEIPSVQLQVSVSDRGEGEEYVVNVIEQHTESNPDLAKVKVQFRTADHIRATRVTHQYDAEHGIVSHTFTYALGDAAGIERSEQSQIVLTLGEALKAGALHPPGGQSVDVELYGAADVIRLNPQ